VRGCATLAVEHLVVEPLGRRVKGVVAAREEFSGAHRHLRREVRRRESKLFCGDANQGEQQV